ncbi:MAG TPA: SURF1 family protein [Noviherbaspirillum sp.]|nr:SURF1 family protein [Noviherbaspirillum sp.]
MPIKFRLRWVPFIATVVVVAIGILLGNWQTRRALEKEAVEAKLSARESAPPLALSAAPTSAEELEYRRGLVRGEFIHDWTVYLDNRPYKGSAGFYVLTPLKIAGSDMHILVARGWAKRDLADRTKLPSIITPEGKIEIEGAVRRHSSQVLQLGNAEPLRSKAIVQNVTPSDFEQVGLHMQPFIIEQLTDTGDGLVRDWPRPSIGVEKHRGYAFQWYGLAAMALIFFVVTGLKRGRQ